MCATLQHIDGHQRKVPCLAFLVTRSECIVREHIGNSLVFFSFQLCKTVIVACLTWFGSRLSAGSTCCLRICLRLRPLVSLLVRMAHMARGPLG